MPVIIEGLNLIIYHESLQILHQYPYKISRLQVEDMSTAKIVEIVGTSDKGWQDAAEVAVNESMKTLRGIRGIEVVDQTAHVDDKTGKITKYKTCVKLSFGVEHT